MIDIEIVRKVASQIGFTVHPRRWVVERTFGWMDRNRLLAKDFSATIGLAAQALRNRYHGRQTHRGQHDF